MSQVTRADLVNGAYRHHRSDQIERREVTAHAAKELGLGEEELRGALRGGSSLSDIAKEKGVSRDRLVGAIGEGLDAATRRTGRSLGGAYPERLAARIADRVARAVPLSHGPAAAYMPIAEPPTLDLLA